MRTFRIIEGDALEVLKAMPDASVDVCLTDPPYDLTGLSRGGSPRTQGSGPFGRVTLETKGFMGKAWDGTGIAFRPETWAEVHRTLKDGSRLLAFGGTRTYHRMACAIEDAGFLIEDCIMWVYGSGFPKHKSKLKPAYEPIVVARKGGASHLNIDACRIEIEAEREGANFGRQGKDFPSNSEARGNQLYSPINSERGGYYSPSGRWPANVILDEESAQLLDEQSGELKSGDLRAGIYEQNQRRNIYGKFAGFQNQEYKGDRGGASRFFYCAKADTAERNAGLEGMPLRPKNNVLGDGLNSATKVRTAEQAENGVNRTHAANTHPTVKPLSLMCWLARLITPEGGTILDPFTGSGSTGIAALRESFNFIGIEREPEYVEIARRRIIGDAPLLNREEAPNASPSN